MANVERSLAIVGFKGLNQVQTLGSDPHTTPSLLNCYALNGNIYGRFGCNEFDSITTASSAAVIGLMDYYRAASQTTSILRMLPTAVELWNGSGSWTDITGTALTGTTAVRPQYDVIDDVLIFTNEGVDRPRYYTGSGNTAVITGTPPYCKAICSYLGFIFLGNYSDAGSTFLPTELIYTDDTPSAADWSLCTGNTITVDDTPGAIQALKVFGRTMGIFKSDSIVSLRFTGGATRFQKERVRFPHGTISPLSIANAGDKGWIFLASDLNLYITDFQTVTPLPPNVQTALRETMPNTMAKYACATSNPETDTYELLYSSSASDTWLDSRIVYNYKTGEFANYAYDGEEHIRILAVRRAVTLPYQVLASTTTLVMELDTGTDDNGTTVRRYYDTGFGAYGVPGEKWLTGADLEFEKLRDCRVQISVATDHSTTFQYAKTFDLRRSGSVHYELPSPIFGTWFNFRIKFYHDAATNRCTLKIVSPRFIAKHSTQATEGRASYPFSA